jgi:hypothetical protein
MTAPRLVRIRPAATIALAAVAAVAIAGCSGSTTPSAIASAVGQVSFPPVGTEAPTSTPAPEASGTSSEAPEASLPTAIPTAIDPCQLITADEASTLVGVKFGAGKEATDKNNLKTCTYGTATNIFTVEVEVAPDEATAQAAEAQAKAELDAKAGQAGDGSLKVTPLPSFADNTDAAILEGSVSKPIAVDARALLLLRGVDFVGFSDVAIGGQAPSQDAMKAQANTVLGKLP